MEPGLVFLTFLIVLLIGAIAIILYYLSLKPRKLTMPEAKKSKPVTKVELSSATKKPARKATKKKTTKKKTTKKKTTKKKTTRKRS
tara:strand:- start:543 stop:800 length:258 start_codon:yes stop_codon:yes gene_type:complete